jgi:hypothetical protein
MPQLTGHHTDPFVHSARRLRRQADQMHPIVAQAFRRRASELEFETWLRRLADPNVDRATLELRVA